MVVVGYAVAEVEPAKVANEIRSTSVRWYLDLMAFRPPVNDDIVLETERGAETALARVKTGIARGSVLASTTDTAPGFGDWKWLSMTFASSFDFDGAGDTICVAMVILN